jgi:chaperonin GroES
MIKEFDPIFDRVLIKREKSSLERKTDKANILLPENVRGAYKSSEGTLVKVGEDCSEVVKELLGKNILFAKYSGDDLKINGDDYVLASERDIFGEVKNA